MTSKEARAYAQQVKQEVFKREAEIIKTIAAQIKSAIEDDPSKDYIQVGQLNKRICAALQEKPFEYTVFDVPAGPLEWETVISWDDSGMTMQNFKHRI